MKSRIVLLFFMIPLYVSGQEIAVPSIVIPEQIFPAFVIEGKLIPGKDTPIGKLDDIILPEITVPAIVLPEINTALNYKEIDDLRFEDVEKILFQEKEEFKIKRNLSIYERERLYLLKRPKATDPVLRLYEQFDLNRSDSLEIDELQSFVNFINMKYSYRHNETAISPNHFILQGGGDCEDFAIMTSEFLTFWGYESYIGIFNNSHSGHAICLLKLDTVPIGKFSFSIMPDSNYQGDRVDSGYYIPIDYNYVGGFSSASEADMTLTHIFKSHGLIGQRI